MQCEINGKKFIFPSSLAEFTLGQRIAFQAKYGDELDEMSKSVAMMEEGLDKDFEIAELNVEKAFRTVAFFADVDVDDLKASSFLDEVMTIYFSNEAVLFEDEKNFEMKFSHYWEGAMWSIASPEVKQGTTITFGEFIDSKQVIKNLSELSKNKWEHLLPLCAIYLRKEGEAYDESFIYEDSDRLKLMESLPLDIAISVGFFLTGLLLIATSISQSSTNQPLNPVNIPNFTLTDGDGSTS